MEERKFVPDISAETEVVISKLRSVYERDGYIRVKMDKRLGGKRTGWEVRIFGNSEAEARWVVEALTHLGLKAGNVYAKRARWVISLYGHGQTQEFLNVIKPQVKESIPTPPNSKDMRRRD